ncbi:MAG: type I 3-dehydroquinate dehydratase [Candidatus Cloacimonetes bacterium]|nr:type I 3-dehydroquinate dehydratase [Candidatus Cloacimonadota bacterium]
MIILSIPYLNNNYVIQKAKEYPNYWKEFRLDYSTDFQAFPLEVIDEKTILTIRSEKEGGKYRIDINDKIKFYKDRISNTNCLCDLEINEITDQDILHIPKNNLILSYHDFAEEIDFTKLKEIVRKSNSLPSGFLKIAVNISKYSDLIRLSKLIPESNKPVIFAGMGKLGKISRILFRYLDADATFIGLPNNPTAKGQLTTEEAEFFKLNSISQKTQIGGIIGGNQVEYSLGIKYYNDLFTKEKLDALYLPFVTDDVDDMWNWINKANINFYGFSITMPFKKIIGAKKQLSAVNLFLPKTSEMLNTDLTAFQKSIEILKIKKAESILIIGSGATAEIALRAFQTFDNITISSRNEFSGNKLAKENNKEFTQLKLLKNCRYDLIINCTPLGTKNEDIIELLKLKLPKKVIELPYKQKNTLLINRCIENEIDYIDGKRFWILQAKVQQQKFIITIHALGG